MRHFNALVPWARPTSFKPALTFQRLKLRAGARHPHATQGVLTAGCPENQQLRAASAAAISRWTSSLRARRSTLGNLAWSASRMPPFVVVDRSADATMAWMAGGCGRIRSAQHVLTTRLQALQARWQQAQDETIPNHLQPPAKSSGSCIAVSHKTHMPHKTHHV